MALTKISLSELAVAEATLRNEEVLFAYAMYRARCILNAQGLFGLTDNELVKFATTMFLRIDSWKISQSSINEKTGIEKPNLPDITIYFLRNDKDKLFDNQKIYTEIDVHSHLRKVFPKIPIPNIIEVIYGEDAEKLTHHQVATLMHWLYWSLDDRDWGTPESNAYLDAFLILQTLKWN